MPDDTSIQGPGPCSPPECPCSGDSSNPVRYFSGKILQQEMDLEIGVPGFSHSRIFLNKNFELNNWDSAQGWNWAVGEWPYLVRRVRTFGEDDQHESLVLKDGLSPLWFDKQADGSLKARYGTDSRNFLTHNSSDGTYTYRRIVDGGVETIVFQDFSQPEAIAGMMKSRVDAQGYVTTVISYGTKTITVLETNRGTDSIYRLNYSFVSSGSLTGKISAVEAEVSDGTSTPTPLRRVRYVYYDGATDEGQLGDLKAAITQQPVPDSSTVQWQDIRVHYYRYANHLLTYLVTPATYALLKQAGQDVLTMRHSSGGPDLVPKYADNYFEYDDSHRVTKEVAQTGKKGTGVQGIDYARTKNASVPRSRHVPPSEADYNTWYWKVVESGNPSSTKTIYTNSIGLVIATVVQDSANPSRQWIEYHRYDSQGREVLFAKPSAVVGISESFPDLVGRRSDGTYTGLRANDGHLVITTFYDSTTATSTTPGGVLGYPEWSYDQKGYAGDLIPRLLRTYLASDNTTGSLSYVQAEEIRFKDEVDTPESRITTSYSYTWYEPSGDTSQRIKEKTTTLPLVPTDEGGDGTSAVQKEFFDSRGNLTWEMDERGVLTSHTYDNRGLKTSTTRDDGSSSNPPGWTPLPGPHFGYTTTYQYDQLGRPRNTFQDPDYGMVGTENVYLERRTSYCYIESTLNEQGLGQPPVFDKTITGIGYQRDDDGIFRAVVPFVIEFKDKVGTLWHQVQSLRTTGSDAPQPTDTYLRSDWARWSSFLYDQRGLLTTERIYFSIPEADTGLEGVSQDIGLEGVNFNQSEYGYATDSTLRLRVKSPEGTITRTTYDALERPLTVSLGTQDLPIGLTNAYLPSSDLITTDMVLVSATEYDLGQAGGDSNVTKVTNYVSDTELRVTRFSYDFRNRKTVESGEEGRYEEFSYDNLDRPADTQSRDGSVHGNLIAKTQTLFNDRSQIYETRKYAVNPSSGTVGSYLYSKTSYDPAGAPVSSVEMGNGGQTSWITYDNLGRPFSRQAGYVDTTVTPHLKVVVEEELSTYDSANFVIASQLSKLDTGAAISSPTYRISYIQAWPDPLARTFAKADLGALSSAPTRPVTPPAPSDTTLLTSYVYNDRGELSSIVQPAGVETRLAYDDKARLIKRINNYVSPGTPSTPTSDVNQTSLFSYTGGNQIATLSSVFANANATQVTSFVYGTTLADSGVASNSLLRSKVYADGTRDTFTYNRQRETASQTDSAGTTHTFLYDGRGRPLHDCVTAFATGIDTAVQRQSRTYNSRGAVEKIISAAYPSPAQGGLISQVTLTYDDFGDLLHHAQSHTGTNAPKTTSYERAGGTGNTNRPNKVIYPSTKTLDLTYGTAGAIDDQLSRVVNVQEETDSTPREVVTYAYLGLDVTVRVDYGDFGVMLDLWGGTAGAYSGLDRFGRIIDHRWINDASEDLARLEYGYNRASQRLYRQDDVARAATKNLDQLYTYDGLRQLTSMHRGKLNTTHDGLETGTTNFQEVWNYDPLGNWLGYQYGPPSGLINQGRSFNQTNEITSLTHWQKPRFDEAGNTTRVPGTLDPDAPFRVVYDAWNRPVWVYSFDEFWNRYKVALHMYDGRGWRIRTQEYKDGEDGPRGMLKETRDYYYDEQWRALEEYTNSGGSLDRLMIWDYAVNGNPDALLQRQRPALDERLAVLLDANFNTVALIDPSGSAVERYDYTCYGIPMYMDVDFNQIDESSVDSNILFSGYRADRLSGTYYVRNRYYSPVLGRWLTRDPIGETQGQSLYGFLNNDPINNNDLSGLTPGVAQLIAAIKAAIFGIAAMYAKLIFDIATDAAISSLEDCPNHTDRKSCCLLCCAGWTATSSIAATAAFATASTGCVGYVIAIVEAVAAIGALADAGTGFVPGAVVGAVTGSIIAGVAGAACLIEVGIEFGRKAKEIATKSSACTTACNAKN